MFLRAWRGRQHFEAGLALDQAFAVVLEDALKRLPPEWRAAVVLRDLEGYLGLEEA